MTILKVREEFTVKDSGARQGFDGGAVRDTQDGKPRYDLIPTWALKRLAEHYAKGAEKYGESNWQKGIPASRMIASVERHLHQYKQGDTEEDHLAAVAFGILGIMHFEKAGPVSTLDLPRHSLQRAAQDAVVSLADRRPRIRRGWPKG